MSNKLEGKVALVVSAKPRHLHSPGKEPGLQWPTLILKGAKRP